MILWGKLRGITGYFFHFWKNLGRSVDFPDFSSQNKVVVNALIKFVRENLFSPRKKEFRFFGLGKGGPPIPLKGLKPPCTPLFERLPGTNQCHLTRVENQKHDRPTPDKSAHFVWSVSIMKMEILFKCLSCISVKTAAVYRHATLPGIKQSHPLFWWRKYHDRSHI